MDGLQSAHDGCATFHTSDVCADRYGRCMCGLCSHVFVRFAAFGYACAASWHNHREQLIVTRTIVSAL